MKGVYKGFEGPNKNGFYTAIIEGQGLPTKFFGHGKKAPKTATGTLVEFDVDERESGDKVYYSIKGSLKELGYTSPVQGGTTASGHGGSTNASIENQVALKAAVEFALGKDGDLKLVVEAFKTFQGLLQPAAATPAKPKPKPVEDQSQDPDDDIPY